MFGGLCFLLNSNMACGVTGEELMVRVGPDGHADTLERPQARTKPFTGRPMKGFVFVSSSGIESDIDLLDWVERGVLFASTFPPK